MLRSTGPSTWTSTHGRDELRLNYLLNYELLASIPPLMEGTIYRARDYLVDTVPTADLLLEIKKIVVEEAVKSAQQAVVQSIAKITEMGVESDIAEVAQDITGGQGGGTFKQIPKSYLSCGGIFQNTEIEVKMPSDQSQLFERDRAGSYMKEVKHHGLELLTRHH